MSNILGNMPPVFGSGNRGVVPAPSAADVSAQNILRADGTWGATPGGAIPSQTGNAGKLLTTDGTNASWASSLNTFAFGDVTFGTSGPSAKSSINARAARQGLVFDGTAAASFSSISLSGAITLRFIIESSFDTANRRYVFWQSGSLGCGISTAGEGRKIFVESASFALSSTSLVAGKKYDCVAVINSNGSVAFYLNGVADGTAAAGTVTSGSINRLLDTSQSASLTGIYVYNRALSAAEVVSLFEAGVPSGADYNSASNTALNTVAPTAVGGGTLSATSATGFTFTGSSATGYVLIPGQSTPALSYGGTKYLVTFSASITTGTVTFSGRGISAFQNTTAVSAGSNSFVIAFNQQMTTNNSAGFEFDSSGTAVYSISNLSIKPLGLLLAPDAGQAGSGLTWYDTSGNAANITLPASGVSWAVLSSQKTASGWTFGGNLTVSGTGGSSIAGKLGIGNASPTYTLDLTTSGSGSWKAIRVSSADDALTTIGSTIASSQYWTYGATSNTSGQGANLFFIGTSDNSAGSISQKLTITSSGNLLIGTTTDGGQKLQVNGTAYVSGDATFAGSTHGTGQQNTANYGGDGWNIDYTTGYVTRFVSVKTSGSSSFSFRTYNSGSDVEALNLSSAGNATLAGTIATQGGTASTPASASATGTAGTIRWDASYIYVCTAANTWKRVAIATW